MEIRTLRYFLAVAREENMTRAAEILHVTQPTLSKQLKSLEEELGKKLFTRHSFSIKLTDEGILLRDRAEDLVQMADKIEQEFLSLDDITGGELYFGLAESYQIKYLARAIKVFKEQYPSLHYHITSGDTEQIADKLDKGLLDFLVLAELPDNRKYEYISFPESDVWGLIIPADDPLAEKETISVSDLKGLHKQEDNTSGNIAQRSLQRQTYGDAGRTQQGNYGRGCHADLCDGHKDNDDLEPDIDGGKEETLQCRIHLGFLEYRL